MAKYEFDKKKFEEWKKAQQDSADIQEKMNSSIGGYLESVKKLSELQKNIQFIEKKVLVLKEEQLDVIKDLAANAVKLKKAEAANNAAEIKALKAKEKELQKILQAKILSVQISEKELNLIKEQTKALADSVKQASLLSAGLNSTVGFLGQTPGLIKKGFGILRGTGIFEMDKEIRNAVRSMAGGSKEYNNMYNTITKVAETTTMWGVGVKDLAIMQQGYTESIGRAVSLTEEGYKAMAGMAEGTGLGKEFAIGMAAEMDKFNISAVKSGKIVEDTMNNAGKLGVNGAAAIKSLQNNLKLAQKFNFKGSIAGLAKLAVEATRLKLDMDGISGMADKVFRPEEAIDMAAQLTTMGGKFGALGDPMQLMFKARNDFAGFSKDIGKASSEFVEFNKETGVFDIKGGLAADRMREISKITGIAVEKLQEMGEAQARVEEIGKNLKGGMFNEADSTLISSLANFEEGKGWVIKVEGQNKLIKDLRETDMKNIRAEQLTLEKRAKEARTFDETIMDLILQFKQFLLPFAQKLKEGLGDRLQKISDDWSKNGFYTSLKEFAKSAAEMVKKLGKWILDITEFLGPKGIVITGLTLALAGKAATWISNGMLLAKGFRMGAGNMGGGGGSSGPGSGFSNAMGRNGYRRGVNGRIEKIPKGRGGGMGKTIGLGVAGLGMEYGRSQMDDPEATGGKVLGIGASTASGAALGSMFGPWGTAIGAVGGLGMGIYDEYFAEREKAPGADYGNVYQSDDSLMFNAKDKFLNLKNKRKGKGGGIDGPIKIAGTSEKGNEKLAKELSSGGNSEMSHKFETLKISIDVNMPGNNELGAMLANDPQFNMRINEGIQTTIASFVGGGKISGGGPKGNQYA
jgi:hypothetical protein